MTDGTDVTARLARHVAQSHWDAVPPPVRHEAKRALLNWLGCALGGAPEPAVGLAVDALRGFSGPASASLVNRPERFDVPGAAFVGGIASSVLDFDDTHLRTVIHPSVPVASAALPLAEHLGSGGAALMHAFVLGVDAECRVGNALGPSHYAAGWHVTSTFGVIGAAVACCRLLGLDAERTTHAVSMAASQSSGLSEMLGSMTRMVNMGHAARNGFYAAWYAATGLTSSTRALEAPRGFGNAFSRECDWSELTRGLGEHWEIAANAYKPYPCGIVVHPVIDACLELRRRHAFAPGAIEHVELVVHPLVQKIMGHPEPADGLRSKVSAQHCTAAALVRGTVGMAEFTDEVARDTAIVALRARVTLCPRDDMPADAAMVAVRLADGTRHEIHVPHAKGSLERPLSDAELHDKFLSLAAWGRYPGDAAALARMVGHLETLADAGALARAARS